MKSLLDIQRDIRTLEKNIQEITDSVRSISSDIECIRNSDEEIVLDYSMIEVLAKQINFGKHPIAKLKDEKACKVYLEMLLNIVRLDPDRENIINRMVFIQWLQHQSRIDLTLEELYINCFKTEKQSIYDLVTLIPKQYKEYFLVDAIIVAGVTGKTNEEICQFIGDIIAIIGFTTKDVRDSSLIAKIALCQKVTDVNRTDLITLLEKAKMFSHYIKDDFREKWIIALRVIVVELRDCETHEFKWKVKPKHVERGEVIATHKIRTKRRGVSFYYETEEIKASESGWIFQFKDNNTYYGVISHDQDNKDSIKAWVKARR